MNRQVVHEQGKSIPIINLLGILFLFFTNHSMETDLQPKFDPPKKELDLSKKSSLEDHSNPNSKYYEILLYFEQKETTRIDSVKPFSEEFDLFLENKAISIKRTQQQKTHPYSNIDHVRALMVVINLKIAQIKRLKELSNNQNSPEKKKFGEMKKKRGDCNNGSKKLNIKSISRKIYKKDPQNTQQKILYMQELLQEENTKNIKAEDRERLCILIEEMSPCIRSYIKFLDQQIENIKKQIERQETNTSKLLLIKKANAKKKLLRTRSLGRLPTICKDL